MHKQKGVVGIVLVLLLVAILVGGYFLWQKYQIGITRTQHLANLGPLEEWKSYTGSVYSFRYPPDYFIRDKISEGVIGISSDPEIYSVQTIINITDSSLYPLYNMEYDLLVEKLGNGRIVEDLEKGKKISNKYGPTLAIFQYEDRSIIVELAMGWADFSRGSLDRVLFERVLSTFELGKQPKPQSIYELPNWIKYTNSVYGYSLQYPSHTFLRNDCITSKRELTGTVTFDLRQKGDRASYADLYSVSVQKDCLTLGPRDRPRYEPMYIIVSDSPREPPRSQSGYKDEKGVLYPSVVVFDKKIMTIDGQEAIKYVASTSFFGDPGNWYTEILFERDGKHYWIRLEEKDLMEEFDQILSTFRFLD